MTEEILEEWEAGEFVVQKCELGIGNVHYHVFSDNLNGKQIAERLEKHIDKIAKERGWEKEDHFFRLIGGTLIKNVPRWVFIAQKG